MHLVLGFDARTVKVDSSWDDSRKNIFLLNKKCDFPKSVDDSVWSSVFYNNEKSKQLDTIFQDYYINLSELERACTRTDKVIVSIALELESCSDDDLFEWSSRLFDGQESRTLLENRVNIPSVCIPPTISSKFTFIGYDVADFWGLSGLMNCGIGDFDDNKTKNFIPFLNKHHLFYNFSKANECGLYLNETVREHAPFFVYSLWIKV